MIQRFAKNYLRKNHFAVALLLVIFGLIGIFTINQSLIHNDTSDFNGAMPQAQDETITQCYAANVSSANITLDGAGNDSGWQNAIEYQIPVATLPGDFNPFQTVVNLKFLFDDSNFYVWALWIDNTPLNFNDGLSFCWNVNCSDFTVDMLNQAGGMRTTESNTVVDNWLWNYEGFSNGSQYNVTDESFGSNGWYPPNNAGDVKSAYTYGTLNNGSKYYQVEIERPLQTGNDLETQFGFNDSVRFAVAIFNDYANSAHAVSGTYDLIFNTALLGTTTNQTPPLSLASIWAWFQNFFLNHYDIYLGTIALVSLGLGTILIEWNRELTKAHGYLCAIAIIFTTLNIILAYQAGVYQFMAWINGYPDWWHLSHIFIGIIGYIAGIVALFAGIGGIRTKKPGYLALICWGICFIMGVILWGFNL